MAHLTGIDTSSADSRRVTTERRLSRPAVEMLEHMTDGDWLVSMEDGREPAGDNFNGGFKTFTNEEDLHDEEDPPRHQFTAHYGIICYNFI